MVDKNLFLYDLAAVAIMKNEGRYLREWLDYHLLAGVEHFYLYDNDSTDNQREVVAPYVAAGLVDYIPAPGKLMQMTVYNDAVKNFRFRCRYMAFIDCDEFIFPKDGRSIAEVVDEILSLDTNAAGVAVNWQIFGSNGHEAADYSRGVLERFTRRAPNDRRNANRHVKTLANPRAINFVGNPHYPTYFEECFSVNELGEIVRGAFNEPVTADKIVLNHYYCKSREEYVIKRNRGRADVLRSEIYTDEDFARHDRNEEFDDGILRYRAARAETFAVESEEHRLDRISVALANNLSPTLAPNTPPKFYAGKMETFLTCRAVADHLKSRLPDAAPAKFFEEAALKAILKLFDRMSFTDARIFLRELPTLLSLPYPAAKEIRRAALNIIPQVMTPMRMTGKFKDYVELDYLRDMLNLGE